MNAIIVDIRGQKAAALGENGVVVQLPNANYSIGQTVELLDVQRRSRPRMLKTVASTAAAAVLLLGVCTGTAYALPYGVVSLDVNPSIEYTINRFDYVLSVQGVNTDGETVVQEVGEKNLLHHKIESAVSVTVDQLEADGYLDGQQPELVITAGTKSDAHSERLSNRLDSAVATPEREIRSVSVSQEEIEAAHESGTTAGRRLLERPEDGVAEEPEIETRETAEPGAEESPANETKEETPETPSDFEDDPSLPAVHQDAEPGTLPDSPPPMEGQTLLEKQSPEGAPEKEDIGSVTESIAPEYPIP